MSATRVYLMADFGNGVRSTGVVKSPDVRGYPPPGRILSLGQDFYGSERQSAVVWGHSHPTQATARAWWLVEAESADAARTAIRAAQFKYQVEIEGQGRILASGGTK